MFTAGPSEAYRPFDSTDADVATYGELELEIGPIGYLRSRTNGQFAPNEVINVGVVPRVELVLQGRELVDGSSPMGLTDTGFFVKGVLREGILQGKRGPSLALEVGPLLPTVGRSAARFGRQRGPHHLVSVALACRDNPSSTCKVHAPRAANPDLFVGAILEGPIVCRFARSRSWYVEQEFSLQTTYSGLVGFIWPLVDELDLDFGTRIALTDGMPNLEIRGGFSWAIPLWH